MSFAESMEMPTGQRLLAFERIQEKLGGLNMQAALDALTMETCALRLVSG